MPDDIEVLTSQFVALPVYEARTRQPVQQAIIDVCWLEALRDLDLHYWFIGDKRPSQPILRRTKGGIDQFGQRKNVNFALHRVIATAIRLGKMPPTLQNLYDEIQHTPATRLLVITAPNGMYDFRNENLAASNQQRGRSAKLELYSRQIAPPEDLGIPRAPGDDELRREALAKLEMTEDQFALLAKPGDDIDTLKARREAESESLIDQIFGGIDKGTPQEDSDGHE